MTVLVCTLGSVSSRAVAEELEGTIKVVANEVEVLVRHKDGRPAEAVSVRLLYGRQLTTAAARTDTQGRWVHAVTRPGPYDAVVEPDTGEVLRLSCIVMESVDADIIPWLPFGLGLGCFAGAAISGLGQKWITRTGAVTEFTTTCLTAPTVSLVPAGAGLLIWSGWCYWWKPLPPAVPPGPDVASAARNYLRNRDVKPLSGSLERLLADASWPRVETMSHPLLGKSAPDFELTDPQRSPRKLREQIGKGPVVLVFYYGYHCNHCVGQLFALHDDIALFRELGAEVLAISADPPEWTQARFRTYGAFAFSVLSDPGNKVAEAFSVYHPASGDLQHGTFLIARDGCVRWAHFGDEPFTGNRTLLFELARLENRLPLPRRPD